MALRARPPDAAAVSRPYAPERFEYRIWGRAFADLPAPDEVAPSAEVYLLTERDGVNAKLRGGALEIKRLLGTRDGLQRWLPALRCPLPLPARVIAQDLCPALGLAPPPLTRRRYEPRGAARRGRAGARRGAGRCTWPSAGASSRSRARVPSAPGSRSARSRSRAWRSSTSASGGHRGRRSSSSCDARRTSTT